MTSNTTMTTAHTGKELPPPLLLPLMVVQRKVLARGAAAASDVANFSPWLDAILFAVTDIERRLPGWFPAGGSILATATRPEI